MRKDVLQILTQGVRTERKHVNVQGMIKAVVTKGYNEPQDSITIDTLYKPGQTMETALINVSFQNGEQFNGTFRDLQGKLFPDVKAHPYFKIIEYVTSDPDRFGLRIGDNVSEKVLEILEKYRG